MNNYLLFAIVFILLLVIYLSYQEDFVVLRRHRCPNYPYCLRNYGRYCPYCHRSRWYLRDYFSPWSWWYYYRRPYYDYSQVSPLVE